MGVAAGEGNKDEMQGMQQALGGPVLEVSRIHTKTFGKIFACSYLR